MKNWIKWLFKIDWELIKSDSQYIKRGGVVVINTYRNIHTKEVKRSVSLPVA